MKKQSVILAVGRIRPFAARNEDLVLNYGEAPSPFGLCRVCDSPFGICHLSFADSGDHSTAMDEILRDWPSARVQAGHIRAGQLVDSIFRRSDMPALLLTGTPFQLSVWRALLDIPFGNTMSYGKLAASLGHPGASRAVGRAVGGNRIAWLIPCHRVLRGDGSIGGYRWGIDRKRAMLAWEAARI